MIIEISRFLYTKFLYFFISIYNKMQKIKKLKFLFLFIFLKL